MDRSIELARLYRRLLNTAPTFRDALTDLRTGGSAEFRRLLDDKTDWPAVLASDWETDRSRILSWFDDIRACDLGRGIDIIHVELGPALSTLEISAWRWADKIMLIDDGLIEPDSIRTVSVPGRVHTSAELSAPPIPAGEFATLVLRLLQCSFIPLEAYATADLRTRWGLDREFAVVFSLGDTALHGGFAGPTGWHRPLKKVEAPEHH